MKLAIVITLTLGVVLTGCGNSDDVVGSEVSALAEDSGEAQNASDQTAALLSVPLQPLVSPSTLSSPEAAAEAAASGGTYFQPSGCVTVTKTSASVTYALNGCTGPLGLVGVSGKLVATFSPAGGSIKVKVVSQGLVIGKIPVELEAGGLVSFVGTKRTFSWDGSYSGTGKSGRTLVHTGKYSGSYDETTSCLELDGSASTKLGAHGVATTTSGYKRCKGCPEAGTIKATGSANTALSISLTYLGGGDAELTGPAGKVYPFTTGWCL